MIIETYAELDFYLKMYRDNKIDLLVIESRGGLGKSRLVEDMFQKIHHIKINSHITALSLYFLGYDYADLPLIFDDVDSLLNNDISISLLKMLCETTKIKKVSWFSTSSLLREKGIPSSYETKSKILLLTNDFKILSKKIRALKDRSWHLEFIPTDEEVLNKINQIKGFVDVNSTNQEIDDVFNLISRYINFSVVSLRTFVKGLALRKYCNGSKVVNWEEILLKEMLVNKKLILIGDLLKNHNRDERIKIWEAKGMSRRSYYDYQTKFIQKSQKVQECKENQDMSVPKSITTPSHIQKPNTLLHNRGKS